MSSTLSVILPNFNDAKYLPATLEALCEQSFAPTELIVIDDGSTDESTAIITEFAAKFSFIKFFKNESNRGVHYTNNRGLKLATGDYIYFGSANDFVLPGFFEKSMSLLAQFPQAGLCCTNARIIDIRERLSHDLLFNWLESPGYLSPQSFARTTRLSNFFNPHSTTCIVRRDLLPDDKLYNPDLGFAADWFINQVISLRHGCCYIPEILAGVRFTRSGYCYNTINNPDKSSYRHVLQEIFQLLALPEYADITRLALRGRSLRSFDVSIQTPMLALKTFRKNMNLNKQSCAVLYYVTFEFLSYKASRCFCFVETIHRSIHKWFQDTKKQFARNIQNSQTHARNRIQHKAEIFKAKASHYTKLVKIYFRTLYWNFLLPLAKKICDTYNWSINLASRVYAKTIDSFSRARAIIRSRMIFVRDRK